MEITKEIAKEFMRDLRGTIYYDSEQYGGGVMPESLVAEIMGVTVEKASDFLWAACRYGFSDRANGMFVV